MKSPMKNADSSDSKYGVWKESQAHWDDREFLASMTPLMRWRYERLDAMVYEKLKTVLSKGDSLLLDVGCGRNEFYEYLRRGPRPSWRYLGVEPSGVQIRNRLVAQPGLGVVLATGENLPLPDMSVDAVLLKEVADHAYDPHRLIKEAYRVLRPGGGFVLSVTNDRAYYKLLFSGVNRRKKEGQKDHLTFFGPSDVRNLLESMPFDRVSIETYNYFKAPIFLERILGALGPGASKKMMALFDRLGRTALPGLGGGILASARRRGC